MLKLNAILGRGRVINVLPSKDPPANANVGFRQAVDSLATAVGVAGQSAPAVRQLVTLTGTTQQLVPISTSQPVVMVLSCMVMTGQCQVVLPKAGLCGNQITLVLGSTAGAAVSAVPFGVDRVVGVSPPIALSVGVPVVLVSDGAQSWYVQSSGSGGGVQSLAVSGQAGLTGNVVLAAGSNVTLSESGQQITIAAPNAMTNPMTTAGDLIVGGTGGTPQRLPVGSNGQVLEVVNGVPAWANAPSGGGWPTANITRVSLPYAIGSTEQVVVVIGGNGNITLPAARSYPGRMIYIKNGTGAAISPTTFYVVSQTVDTIDTRLNYSYQVNPIGSANFVEVLFVSDGNGTWWSIAAGA